MLDAARRRLRYWRGMVRLMGDCCPECNSFAPGMPGCPFCGGTMIWTERADTRRTMRQRWREKMLGKPETSIKA